MSAPIVDAGPLISLFDVRDPLHDRATEIAASVSGSMHTTCPTFTEVLYFLGARCGSQMQRALWMFRARGRIEITPFDWDRAAELMAQYSDGKMDLADASLVALAEERHVLDVLTWDSDFYAYRIRGTHEQEMFHVIGPTGG